MNIDLHDPHFWVLASFLLFVGLAYKKVSTLGANALDSRTAQIKAELDEARRLREEAEGVLNQYKQKQAQYLKEAEEMLTRARKDAETIAAQAQKDLQVSLDERMKNALEKIAQEENNAITEVRAHVVDVALSSARKMIAEQASGAQDKLLASAISDIERKIH